MKGIEGHDELARDQGIYRRYRQTALEFSYASARRRILGSASTCCSHVRISRGSLKAINEFVLRNVLTFPVFRGIFKVIIVGFGFHEIAPETKSFDAGRTPRAARVSWLPNQEIR